jgi:hypothetical protein
MAVYPQLWVRAQAPLELLAGVSRDGNKLAVVIDTQFTGTNEGWLVRPVDGLGGRIAAYLSRTAGLVTDHDLSAKVYIPAMQLIVAIGKRRVSPIVRGWLYSTAHALRTDILAAQFTRDQQEQMLTLTIALALEQGTVDKSAMRDVISQIHHPLDGVVAVACLAAGVPAAVSGAVGQSHLILGPVLQQIRSLSVSPYTTAGGIRNATGWLCFFSTTMQCMAAVRTINQSQSYTTLVNRVRSGGAIINSNDYGGALHDYLIANNASYNNRNNEIFQQLYAAFVQNNNAGNGQQDLIDLVQAMAINQLLPVTKVETRETETCPSLPYPVINADTRKDMYTHHVVVTAPGRVYRLMHHSETDMDAGDLCNFCHLNHVRVRDWTIDATQLEAGKALVVSFPRHTLYHPVDVIADRVLSFTNDPRQLYVLRSVALYTGHGARGHYTAVVELANGSWAEISDDCIVHTNMTFAQVQQLVRSRRPAALFYERTYD